MANSYKAQANLQLLLAEKCVNALKQGDSDNWGDYFALMMTESVIFRLRLAYACHIADLLEERQFAGICYSAEEALRALGSDRDKVPELDELQEREEMNGWLRELLTYNYITEPSAGSSARTAELLAVDRGGKGPESADLELWIAELRDLITRHRDTMFEW